MKRWFVLRVQSGREDSVREALWKRIQVNNLTEEVTTLLVPTERITEMKGKTKRVKEQKLYPGYLMAEIDMDAETGEIPDDVWFLIRETPGIGDFVGNQMKPHPMPQSDVDKMLARIAATDEEEPQLKIEFEPGDSVKIKEGPFENFDGVVDDVIPAKGLVKVIVTIFGRPTPVELEYWQVESI